jgi:hypothetical protein
MAVLMVEASCTAMTKADETISQPHLLPLATFDGLEIIL